MQQHHQTVLNIIKNISLKTSIAVAVGTAVALAYTLFKTGESSWWSIPAGVLFGGVLGLLNFRWLAFAVERKLMKKFIPPAPQNPLLMLLNGIKLAAIFIVLFVVMKWQLVNIFGMIIGLSLCFCAIIWEGLMWIPQARSKE